MTKYKVQFDATVFISIPVEADSIEAAIEEAQQEGVRPLCPQCLGPSYGTGEKRWSREIGDEWVEVAVLDENDDQVWTGLDFQTQRVISELECLASTLDGIGWRDAASLLWRRMATLNDTVFIPEIVGDADV